MRSLVAILLCLVALGSAIPMPRYLVIPLDNMEVAEALFSPKYRVRRSAQQQLPETGDADLDARVINSNRRQGGGPLLGPVVEAPVDSSFIKAVKAAGIPNADDSLAAGSQVYGHPPKGNDYVDYGAYTGKHGAFGWYSDHPVALNVHHY